MRSVPEFFNVQPVESALRALFAASHVEPCPVTIPTRDALGRVLAVAPRSPIDLPELLAQVATDGRERADLKCWIVSIPARILGWRYSERRTM
jgi:molybdopterin biosynthesis enzyme